MAGFTQVTVTGTFKSSGVAQVGQVVWQLSTDLQDGAGLISPAIPKTATLDVNGKFSIVLDAVDDPTTTPAGQVYTCTKYVVGEQPTSVKYTISRATNPVDIAQLTPQTAAVPNYPVLRKDSDTLNAFNLGASGALDPSLGFVQRVTLTQNMGAITGVVNLPAGTACDFWVELVQDNSGGRYVTWPTSFLFPGGAVPALTQTRNAVDRFHVVTANGTTFEVDGGVPSAFAGVDPLTVPTITDILEAWTQPYRPTETIATPIGAKGGPWSTTGTVVMGEGWRYNRGSGLGIPQPLDRFGDRRFFFDCTAAASGLLLTKAFGGTGNPFTIIMAGEIPTNVNNGSFIESTAAGGAPQLYYNTTDLFSIHDGTTNQFVNWVQTSPPAGQAFGYGQPFVIAFYGDGTSGATGWQVRLNGINCTQVAGTQQQFGTASTALMFSKGVSPFVDGLLKISAIYASSTTMLDFSTTMAAGRLVERFAAAPLGLII